jgi:hypothetical protein
MWNVEFLKEVAWRQPGKDDPVAGRLGDVLI